MVIKNCLYYKRGKEKESDKSLEKVLIPNKSTHESTIKYGMPTYGSSEQEGAIIRHALVWYQTE